MTSAFILEPKVANLEHLKFNVTRPSKKKWAGLFAFILISFYYWGLIVGGGAIIFFAFVVGLAIGSWKILGRMVLSKFVDENFESYISEKVHGTQRFIGLGGKIKKYLSMLLGIYLDTNKDYFIEEEVPDVDMTHLKEIFKDRLIDLMSACLGVTVLFASVLRAMLPKSDLNFRQAREVFGALTGFVLLISPILVGWLIPVIWTLQDSAVREVTKRNTVREVAANVKNGALNRLLGFTGILGGLSLLIDILPLVVDNGQNLSFVEVYFLAVIVLFITLIAISGPAYLTGLLYFIRYHERNVNNLRRHLYDMGIPLGMTMVRNANEEEIKKFEEIFEKET